MLDNAAREPEIVDLCNMLIEMGARITGAGSNTITVDGVDKLEPITHEVVGDRIVAGTWAYAAAMTRGDITVGGINPSHLHLALEKLKNAGANVARTPSITRRCPSRAFRRTFSQWPSPWPA